MGKNKIKSAVDRRAGEQDIRSVWMQTLRENMGEVLGRVLQSRYSSST